MNRPKFDIIITSFNVLFYLKKCLHSIRKYTKDFDYRITVVDNGSGDGTKSYLKNKKRINFISLNKNLGPAKAFNKAFKATDREFIVRVDDDCEVSQGWLKKLYKSLLSDEQIAIVGVKAVLTDNRIYGVDDLAKYSGIYGYGEIDRGQRNYLKFSDLIPGCCMFFRRSLVKDIGPFDEQLFCYEDMDFCLRARIAGYKILYNGKQKIIHHSLKRYWEKLEKNKAIFLKKWSNFHDFPLPDSHEADKYNTWGLDALVNGKFKKAYFYFNEVAQIDKRLSLPFFTAISLWRIGKIPLAIEKLNETLYLNPTDCRDLYYLVIINAQSGNQNEALNFLKKGLKVIPKVTLEYNIY